MSKYGPEEELCLLLALHEDAVSMLESNEYEFHASQPGSSTEMVERLHKAGQITITNRFNEMSQRTYAVAHITDDGRRRMRELIATGVQPSDDEWID